MQRHCFLRTVKLLCHSVGQFLLKKMESLCISVDGNEDVFLRGKKFYLRKGTLDPKRSQSFLLNQPNVSQAWFSHTIWNIFYNPDQPLSREKSHLKTPKTSGTAWSLWNEVVRIIINIVQQETNVVFVLGFFMFPGRKQGKFLLFQKCFVIWHHRLLL